MIHKGTTINEYEINVFVFRKKEVQGSKVQMFWDWGFRLRQGCDGQVGREGGQIFYFDKTKKSVLRFFTGMAVSAGITPEARYLF